jgi:hypothetical protein
MKGVSLGVVLAGMVVMLSVLPGCIAYRAGRVPDEPRWPPVQTGGSRKTVSLHTEYVNKFVSDPRVVLFFSEHDRALFEDSGIFWKVVRDPSSETVDAHVFLRVTEEASWPWWTTVLQILTGWLIPKPSYFTTTAELEVRDASGNRVGVVTESETETTLVSILFLPVVPFTHRPANMDVHRDTVRAAIISAVKKGLF